MALGWDVGELVQFLAASSLHAPGPHSTICEPGMSVSCSHTLCSFITTQRCWRKGFASALSAQLRAGCLEAVSGEGVIILKPVTAAWSIPCFCPPRALLLQRWLLRAP